MTSTFKLSLAHATVLDLSPPDLVQVAAAAGYEAVGLRLIPVGRPGEPQHALHEHPDRLRQTQRALKDARVRLLDVEVVQIAHGLDARSYLPALEAAAELGARFALTNVYEPDRRAAEDSLSALCDMVAPLGLTIALEFVSFSSLRTLEDTIGMVRRCGHNNVAVLIDTLHFHSSGESLSALADLPSDRVHFVHVCDGPHLVPAAPDDRRRIAREDRLLPGEGGIDVAGILQRLPQNIVYAVEAHNPARAAALGADAYARLAFEKTMRYLEAHLEH